MIFVADQDMLIGIAELKGKTAHADEITEKLTNASEIAVEILERIAGHFTRFDMYHMVLAKEWDPSEHRVLSKRKITVRGKRCDIVLKRCGGSFSEMIARLRA